MGAFGITCEDWARFMPNRLGVFPTQTRARNTGWRQLRVTSRQPVAHSAQVKKWSRTAKQPKGHDTTGYLFHRKCSLRVDLRGIDLDVESRPAGQCNMCVFHDRRILLEVMIVPHLGDQVFTHRKGHWRLAEYCMYRRSQAVPMRDHGHIVERCHGADLEQFAKTSAPLRVSLHDGDRSRLQVAFNFPASVEVLARRKGYAGPTTNRGKTVDLFRMRDFFHPAWPVLLNSFGPLECVILVPAAKRVEHDFVVFAQRLSRRLNQLDVLVHSLRTGTWPIAHKPFLIAKALVLELKAAPANGLKFERESKRASIHLDLFAGRSAE